MDFTTLYNTLSSASVNNSVQQELAHINEKADFDEHHLDCLLHPNKQPLVWRLSSCDCGEDQKNKCEGVCFFDALSHDENGNVKVSLENWTGCHACIDNCKSKNLVDRKDILPVFELLNSESPVYAIIAPAFISQFSEEVTPSMLRSAFKSLGFSGMLEVALFADILTLKEALEFDHSIKDDKDFMLTSCCCPLWIAMIRKIYNDLMPHVPPSVSPMVACGRAVKTLYPNAKTVFIGPCLAKKAEAKEKDVADAVDIVLTFREIQDIFDFANINLTDFPQDLREHSSTAGRIYARTGGVSEAVQSTLDRLKPDRIIPLRATAANGVAECKALLNELKNGNVNANFLEGMGCVGGCVGGPRAIIDKELGRKQVNRYGEEASYKTPVDNPYVIELLNKLGFNTIEDLSLFDNMFVRNFL